MDWSSLIEVYRPQFERVCKQKIDVGQAERLFRLIDLTRLNEDDTENDIALLCKNAITSLGHVAGVCVYPRFTKMIASQFDQSSVRTITVANFPQGTKPLEGVLVEIEEVLVAGANEIDMVFPYQQFLDGAYEPSHDFVYAAKAACGSDVKLKVIVESAVYPSLEKLAEACRLIINAGADFLKTSTGKITKGASVEAALVMLTIIKEENQSIGFKAAGGIREPGQALGYLTLAEEIMGRDWVQPERFRIGASQLVDHLIQMTR